VKPRTVLAVLLLHAGAVVSVDRLIDEVWRDGAPRSAGHTLEGYVSRLRGVVMTHGVGIVRIGRGYRLDLGDAWFDVAELESLAEGAAEAARSGRHDLAETLARQALGLWRGPSLADVPLDGHAARLDELRLRVIEQRLDAELGLANHERAVAELRSLVAAHPHRERLVAQLMIALYRSGRQVDALSVYEETRRRLAHDLGLQPSAELQRLSGGIVRQEAGLTWPRRPNGGAPPAAPRGHGRRPRLVLTALGVAAAAAATIAVVGSTGARPAPEVTRVALLLETAHDTDADTGTSTLLDGLRRAELDYGIDGETVVVTTLEGGMSAPERAARELRSGGFDLVVAPFGTLVSLLGESDLLPRTRFVALDLGWNELLPEGTTGFLFDGRESGYLVGYLAGLVERRRLPRLNLPHVVSVIGARHGVAPVEDLVGGFAAGARRAFPRITVIRGYSGDSVDQSRCEAIANRQIDLGSDIVFGAAGSCSLGAMAAAGIRGVWGIGLDADRSYLGDHILASAVKRYDRAVIAAIGAYVHGTLPADANVQLGLDSAAVGIAGISPAVPDDIRRRVAAAAAALRRGRRP